jgi:hypothetical protein
MPKVFISPFKGGTTSVGRALELAGINSDVCMSLDRHSLISEDELGLLLSVNGFLEQFKSFLMIPKHIKLEINSLFGEMLHRLSDGFDVFSDVPLGHETIHPYIKKIVFGECRFIFLERDRDSYVKSARIQLLNSKLQEHSHCEKMINIAPLIFDSISWNNYIKWRSRYLDLSRLFPKEVLFMKVSDGWSPLERFLGFDAPKIPFPWENKSTT